MSGASARGERKRVGRRQPSDLGAPAPRAGCVGVEGGGQAADDPGVRSLDAEFAVPTANLPTISLTVTPNLTEADAMFTGQVSG